MSTSPLEEEFTTSTEASQTPFCEEFSPSLTGSSPNAYSSLVSPSASSDRGAIIVRRRRFLQSSSMSTHLELLRLVVPPVEFLLLPPAVYRVMGALRTAYSTSKALLTARGRNEVLFNLKAARRDVVFAAGREATIYGTGMLIGKIIAALGVPILGQIIVTAALGTAAAVAITRFTDRLLVRMKLRAKYGYPKGEYDARRWFESLLERQHDLSDLATCTIVQHYSDYRVACGWESASEMHDYRATGEITLMPASFRHFAVVQLQRKWGFLHERKECKKVYKALLLLHHPDRGGNADMTAQLTHDFEIYAFCQGWEEDSLSILPSQREKGSSVKNARRRNVVVNFLRSLFHSTSSSSLGASDLQKYGLLTLEAGTREALRQMDQIRCVNSHEDREGDGLSDYAKDASFTPSLQTTLTVKKQSISRILNAIQYRFRSAMESITFVGLQRVYENPQSWEGLRRNVFWFSRMQNYVRIALAQLVEGGGRGDSEGMMDDQSIKKTFQGFVWYNIDDAVRKREQARSEIVIQVFTDETNKKISAAHDLWSSAKSMVENLFKQSTSTNTDELAQSSDGTDQTLDTLLAIQKQLEAISEVCETDYCTRTEIEKDSVFYSFFVESIKEVGYFASSALAGSHAWMIRGALLQKCDDYFRSWGRKRNTIRAFVAEHEALFQELSSAKHENQKDPKKREVSEKLKLVSRDFRTQIIMAHQQLAEVDSFIEELYEIYRFHFPEHMKILKKIPSSCGYALSEKNFQPRYIPFESERTLFNYTHISEEPFCAIDIDSLAKDYSGYTLLQATYLDPLASAVSPCWLKRYEMKKIDSLGRGEMSCHSDKRLQHLLHGEFQVTERCSSPRILSPQKVFCDEIEKCIYFHLPRGFTQQRFRSIHDVRKRIQPLGVHWLHDAIQCLIELHSCQVYHGNIRLCSFTYDDFSNTTLAFFSCMPSIVLDDLDSSSMTVPLTIVQSHTMEEGIKKDVIDFGATIIAEIVPFLEKCDENEKIGSYNLDLSDMERDLPRLFLEVGERLIGKQQPHWDLLDARSFLRRYLQFHYSNSEENYLFSKEITFPPFWAARFVRSAPLLQSLDNRVQLLNVSGSHQLYLNQNVALWETYWHCRRRMVLQRGGSAFPSPLKLKQVPPFIPCSDDCDVNERFMWYGCDEEEAWRISHDGFRYLRDFKLSVQEKSSSSCRLSVVPVPKFNNGDFEWAIVFRVVLGTVQRGGVEDKDESDRQFSSDPIPVEDYAVNLKSTLIAHNGTKEKEWVIDIPVPWLRCYPEYIVKSKW